MDFDMIVAYSVPDYIIGNQGKMPWPKLSKDLKHFQDITSSSPIDKQNAVIMGRKTWDSLPIKPLPKRLNCIISKTHHQNSLCLVFKSLDQCLSYLSSLDNINKVFVIGGGQLYQQGIKHKNLKNVFATEIYNSNIKGDVYFPIESNLIPIYTSNIHTEKDFFFRFVSYIPQKKKHSEFQYLDLLQKVLTQGKTRNDRTNTGTISLFGERIEFDLDPFPLLTTKRVFWRGIVEELLWFLRGSTDAKQLQQKNIHIWDGNSTRDFLDKRGLTEYQVGELGPVYGFQWRNFGASYQGCHIDYSKKGVDQIEYVIDQIKNNPISRRILCSAWNPADLDKMALPPCHIMFQFYVDGKKLNCQMYQRSADLFLGLPFNIASYGLLTYIIAQRTNLEPGKLSICIGDAHIYKNHVEACLTQLSRDPKEFPKLRITRHPDKIGDYTIDDFIIDGYKPNKRISAPMSA